MRKCGGPGVDDGGRRNLAEHLADGGNQMTATLGDEMLLECEEIKRQLPISTYARPAWDLETLGRIGVKDFQIDLGISGRIYREKDEFYNPTPLFLLRVCKEKEES